MSWAIADIAGDALALFLRDAPLLGGRNKLADCSADPQWRTSGSWTTGSDVTQAHYRTHRAYDGWHHAPTRPSSGAAHHYLILDFGSEIAFDLFGIFGHNFHLLGGVVTVSLQVADNSAYTTNLQTLQAWSPSAIDRIFTCAIGAGVIPGINNAGLVTGVRYARIKIDYDGGAPHPEISEVYFGSRFALPRLADLPEAHEDLETLVDTFEGGTGHRQNVSRYHGRKRVVREWGGLSSAEADVFTDWYLDTHEGGMPGIWVEHPYTDGDQAHVVEPGASIDVREADAGDIRVGLVALERAPLLSMEA